MKKTAVLLSIVVLTSVNAASAGVTTLPPPAYPQGTYQQQPVYQQAPVYAPPVAYAPAPVVYYTTPPVVYYAPTPVYYAPAPVSYGGYGCDPLFGFVSLIFNYGGDDHYYGNGGRHGNHGNGGGSGHRNNYRNYYRAVKNNSSGHHGAKGGNYRAGR